MRILVIEDEADLLASLAKALREEGYAVDIAADGEDGLHKAQSRDYDAIVLDGCSRASMRGRPPAPPPIKEDARAHADRPRCDSRPRARP